MRARRRAVGASERTSHARAIARHVARSVPLRRGARIALYSSLPEEVDTAPLLEWARRRGLRVYLPRIVDRRRRIMRFCSAEDCRLEVNAYDIPEPAGGAWIAPRWLDAVFLPLVAFDDRGARLGMGRGYYDRALAFRRVRHSWRGPMLVGIAYAFQRVDRLRVRPHDVRLDAVVTERGILRCRGELT